MDINTQYSQSSALTTQATRDLKAPKSAESAEPKSVTTPDRDSDSDNQAVGDTVSFSQASLRLAQNQSKTDAQPALNSSAEARRAAEDLVSSSAANPAAFYAAQGNGTRINVGGLLG
ncbi:hypothetical protein ACQE3E_14560 [Methylomonas sp. MED-D]|uniref:hypothetical protein n=1 Tax=unclassified Methylomonas TaxID=2608980 RepID=UPI00143B0EC0|nr:MULTISPECIES: hypothetical protein [unclassified Methylomonas]MDT4331357.1 hypothetical protein [Methylomonas sp. MV1]NJA05442.1 hypothetical protein [Methylococcaceae bacterium WWC4]WGS84510.1 hypothetical protein QC632_15790 [Methylomonas sp. UP202]